MRVWIDQDLCTGDGLCTDHCPEIFVLLEDGLSYVRDGEVIGNDPGGIASAVGVPPRLADQVVAAAVDCPGECIFVDDDPAPADGAPGSDAEVPDAEVPDAEVPDAEVVVRR